MALKRINEVVTDVSTLKLRQSYVNEGRIPEATALGIDGPGRILGRVSGIGFMGDFASGNGRWYPAELWRKTCSADYVLEQLDAGLMYGQCGHPKHDEGVRDEDIGTGLHSHVISKLDFSNDPTGVIEYYILDTNAGRNLYAAYCYPKTRLSVSSRAMADYVPYEEHDGMPIMDPESYWLDTFDIVRVPGIAVASPDRIELFEATQRKIESVLKKPSKIQISVPSLKQTVAEAMSDKPYKVSKKIDYSGFIF